MASQSLEKNQVCIILSLTGRQVQSSAVGYLSDMNPNTRQPNRNPAMLSDAPNEIIHFPKQGFKSH